MDKILKKVKSLNFCPKLLSFAKSRSSGLTLLLAFLTIIFTGLMGIWVSITIFERHKPSFIQYEVLPQVYNPKIQFNTDDFKFGLAVLDFGDTSSSFVTFDWAFLNEGTGEVFLNVNEECQFDIFPGKNFNCFYQDEGSKGESYLDSRGSYSFNIRYHSCYWSHPDGAGCAYEDIIEQNVKNWAKSTLVYEDVMIDPYNYENPITTVETDMSTLVWANVGTTLVIELNEVEFTSDNGWIFEDLKTVKKLKASTSIKITAQEMLNIQLVYGGKKTVYKRTYPKIQDFFAQISGFIAIITPMLLIFVSQYGNRQAIQHVIDDVYEIKLKKPESRKSIFLSTGAGTERNLLPQEAMSKFKNRAGIAVPPHAALVIGCLDENLEKSQKLPEKDDASPIPEENIQPFRFDSLEKSPSSPLRSTLISPRHDESKLLSTILTTSLGHQLRKKPQNQRLNKNLDPIETNRETGNKSLAEEDSVNEEEEEVPLRTSEPLKIPWKDWFKSFWKPSPKVQMLKKAKDHIMETFDLVTLSKKVSEIDKLKACLLTHEQRVIFENLPSSVIVLNTDIDINSPEAIKQYHWDDSSKGDKEALKKAYVKLKETKTELDKLLLKLYESEYIYDGLSS